MTSKESSGAPDTDSLKEAAAIGRQLAKLDDEFGRRIDKAQWLGNFQLVNGIRLADAASTPKGRDDAIVWLNLGLEIGKQMGEIFTHHRSKQRGTIEASFGLRSKPDFIDFRQKLDAIKPPPRKTAAKK